MNRKATIIAALRNFCKTYRVEIVLQEYGEEIQIYNVPRDMDLDRNDNPREYPILSLERVTADELKEVI